MTDIDKDDRYSALSNLLIQGFVILRMLDHFKDEEAWRPIYDTMLALQYEILTTFNKEVPAPKEPSKV